MANGNPFYIHPGGDYSQGLQGLAQTAMRATEMRRKQQATEDAAAKFAAMKAGALEAYRSGDPVKMAEFSLANPEMAQAMKAAMGFYNDATEKNYQDSLFNLYQNPTRDNAAEVVESRQKFLRGQGVPSEQTQETDGFMSRFEENPEGIRVQVGRELAFRYPERFKAMQEATSPAAVLKLTANQKDYKLAKDEGFTGTFMEYQRALKEDPAQDLELQKLKVQIEDIQERREARKQKAEDRKLIKEEKTRGIVSGIDSVLEEVDKAIMQVKDSPSATGITGFATQIIPGSPAYNLRRTIDTVRANLGFDKLQAMRDASPTGGALGQVSERELNFLQSTLTALDPNMGDERLIEGLNKVKRHYDNWRMTLKGEMPEDNRPVAELSDEELLQKLGR